MLHTMDDKFLRPLVILDKDLAYHVYPESGIKMVEEAAPSLFMFSTDVASGMLRGYGMRHGPVHVRNLYISGIFLLISPDAYQNNLH